MEMAVALTLFLINLKVFVVYGQDDISEDTGLPKEFGLNPNDFAQITDADIRFLLQTMDLQSAASRIPNPSKYCQSFKSCHECVKSRWYSCEWCHDVGCTDKSRKRCPLPDELSSSPRNLSSCSHIHTKSPILVPSGVKTHVAVKISVSDPALLKKDLVCQINLKNQMKHFKGVLMDNIVYCFPLRIVITDGIEIGSFNILWGGVQPMSNEIPLLAYRCDRMANDCEECKQLPRQYACGWCEEIQKCSLADKCNDVFKWSINKVTCQFGSEQLYFV